MAALLAIYNQFDWRLGASLKLPQIQLGALESSSRYLPSSRTLSKLAPVTIMIEDDQSVIF